MKKYFLTITAALLAIFLFADGDIIVMDRAYYDQCANGFYTQLAILDSQLDIAYNVFSTDLNTIHTYADNSRQQVYLANLNASYLLQSPTLDNAVDRERAQNILDQTSASLQNQDRLIATLDSLTNTLAYTYADLKGDVVAVSNSFPTVITSTNFVLEVTVIVSNNFDFATNALEQAQHSYTNFLNYYRGIEDEMLDQFRATVTNLLDWSEFPNWVDYTRWRWGSGLSSGTSMIYSNIYFPQVNWDVILGYGYAFNSGSVAVKNWTNFRQLLPLDSSYPDYLMFSIQGIHDSVEQSAKIMTQLYNGLIVPASTNSQFTYIFTTSQTNAIAQFLKAPETYDQQVAKIARSRNLFQRIEHWLSAIAKNTFKEDKPQPDEDTESSRQQTQQGITNDVSHALSGTFEGFNEIGDRSTNVFAVAKTKFSDNITGIYNVFTSGGSSRRSGNDQSAAQRFQKLEFMEMNWASELLQSKTHKNNDIPNYLHVSDIDHGNGSNSAWSISMRLVDIIHKVFGILWCLIGFGLGIYEIVMLTKFFIVIWWRLLKYIPNIARYALGT